MSATTVRSQPDTLAYSGGDPQLGRLFTLAEEMFEILFQDLKKVNDAAGSGSSQTFTAGTGISIAVVGGVVTITNTGPTIAQVAARVAVGV